MSSDHSATGTPQPGMTTPTWRYALTVGVAVLGLFASQGLLPYLDASLHLGTWGNLVTTLTLAGYATGLLFLVPLIDLLPCRPLIVGTLAAQALAAAAAAMSHSAPMFLVASFAIGWTSSAIQMIVPVVASMVPEARRGRVVGDVMSGLMAGILLSRPLASELAGSFGWRCYYTLDALALLATAGWLWVNLADKTSPARATASLGAYRRLISSLVHLVLGEPVLRRRALYQGLLMAAFNAFWTSVALVLTRAPFALGHTALALFMLSGAGGTLVAPLAGRLGDHGHERAATTVFHALVIVALGLAAVAGSGLLGRGLGIGLMAASAILLDVGVVGDQTLGRRAVNLLGAQTRGRVNGLYTGLFFIGSTVGAFAAGPAWFHGGWAWVCGTGAIFAALALGSHLFLSFGAMPGAAAMVDHTP